MTVNWNIQHKQYESQILSFSLHPEKERYSNGIHTRRKRLPSHKIFLPPSSSKKTTPSTVSGNDGADLPAMESGWISCVHLTYRFVWTCLYVVLCAFFLRGVCWLAYVLLSCAYANYMFFARHDALCVMHYVCYVLMCYVFSAVTYVCLCAYVILLS